MSGPALGSQPQPPTSAQTAYPARQVDPALAVPAGDQAIEHLDVPRGNRAWRAACHDRQLPEHPGPHRGGQAGQPGGVRGRARPRLGWRRQPPGGRGGQLVQGVGVGAQLAGRPGQRLGYPGAERCLQGGQRLLPDPDPGVAAVGIVRVLPRLQAECRAGGGGAGPADAEQRAAVAAASLGHSGQ
jgi:hypothetical protein